MEGQGKSKTKHQEMEAEKRRCRISVMLIAGHRIESVGLRTLLLDHDAVRLVADVGLGPAAIDAVKRTQPEVVLVGCDQVTEVEIDLIRQLRTQGDDVRILIFADEAICDRLPLFGQVLINGCLAWSVLTRETLGAILTLVLVGIRVGSSTTGAPQSHGACGHEEPLDDIAHLTESQRLVMHGLADGLTERQTAKRCGVAERTVRLRVRELKDLFQVKSEADLRPIARALRLGSKAKPL